MKRLLLPLIALGLSGGPALAEPSDPVDLLFRTQHLAETDPALALQYRHTRETAAADVMGPALESTILLRQEPVGDAHETVITMDAAGAARRLDSFRGVPGNPILMVFMETIVSSLTRATGGSPFYIRNRLKEAFANGIVTGADGQSVILMRPFEADRNRARMGPFADLEIEMSLDAAKPGMFATLVARADDPSLKGVVFYREEMSYVGAE